MESAKHSNKTGREPIPAWKTQEECEAYCEEQGDMFFLTAFMIEAWLGGISSAIVQEYAEKKSGKRHLQTGQALKSWQQVFGHVEPDGWGDILDSLGRFSRCDAPESVYVARVLWCLTLEDRYVEPGGIAQLVAKHKSVPLTLDQLLDWMRNRFRRINEWMEALVHWQTHWMAGVAPIAFGPTEEERELVQIGFLQANYSKLDERSRGWWQFRHDDLAQQFAGQPTWRLLGQAQAYDNFRDLRHSAVDELTILWWPLFVRYRWTDRDMRLMVRRMAPHPDSYPLREDKEFADYRKKALGLVRADNTRCKSTKDGKPRGWQVALAMAGQPEE